MISLEPGKEERVLWIDFDSAQTFPENEPLSSLHETWLREENELVDYFFKILASFQLPLPLRERTNLIKRQTQALDYADGKLSRAWKYYYERI